MITLTAVILVAGLIAWYLSDKRVDGSVPGLASFMLLLYLVSGSIMVFSDPDGELVHKTEMNGVEYLCERSMVGKDSSWFWPDLEVEKVDMSSNGVCVEL